MRKCYFTRHAVTSEARGWGVGLRLWNQGTCILLQGTDAQTAHGASCSRCNDHASASCCHCSSGTDAKPCRISRAPWQRSSGAEGCQVWRHPRTVDSATRPAGPPLCEPRSSQHWRLVAHVAARWTTPLASSPHVASAPD
eukprot:6535579-Prymnesium_polylepis.1